MGSILKMENVIQHEDAHGVLDTRSSMKLLLYKSALLARCVIFVGSTERRSNLRKGRREGGKSASPHVIHVSGTPAGIRSFVVIASDLIKRLLEEQT